MDLVEVEFSREVAKNLDVNSAIVLKNIELFVIQNTKTNNNFFDGRFWTDVSAKELSEVCNWLSESQIRNSIKKLLNKRYLSEGNYSDFPLIRKKWYSINEIN